MIGHWGGGGDVKMLKMIYSKNKIGTYLYKPVGKYQSIMACIRALVMIVYQVINCLISQPKHMLWVLAMRRFFKHGILG